MKLKAMVGWLVLNVVCLAVTHGVVLSQASQHTGRAIAESTQAANATVTKLLVNDVYPRLVDLLGLESGQAPQGLTGAALDETDRILRTFIFGTDIMKVKIFGKNGLTVYSTEREQIGQDQSNNPALVAATQGAMGSQTTHRGTFNAAEGQVYDRDLVSSYIPIRNAAGLVIGVAEIYTDRTPILSAEKDGEGSLRPMLLLLQSIQLIVLLLGAWVLVITQREGKAA